MVSEPTFCHRTVQSSAWTWGGVTESLVLCMNPVKVAKYLLPHHDADVRLQVDVEDSGLHPRVVCVPAVVHVTLIKLQINK